MPVVNYPLECQACRGKGQVKPACAFDVNRNSMMIECLICQGRGTVDNKVYVNPMPDAVLPIKEPVIESPIVHDDIYDSFNNEVVEKTSNELRKVKRRKSDIINATG